MPPFDPLCQSWNTRQSRINIRPAMVDSLPSRLRAAGIHLFLSAIVFAIALYLILVHWYPGFHFTVDGGWQGVRIMAAVDLVLGPVLTLIVFNPRKARRLIAFDLACIGIAQLAALVWGFYAVHSQHPVAVSWHGGAFHAVTAEPLRIESYDTVQLKTLSDERPALVYVAAPANADEEARVSLQMMVGGAAEYEDPFFFRPFGEHWNEVKAAGRSAEDLRKTQPGVVAEFEAAGGPKDTLFFDYQGRFGTCVLALDASGRTLGAWGCETF